MADFCTYCALKTFGEGATPEIDITLISSNLKEDTYEIVLCEGCGMQAIGKSSLGEIYVAIPIPNLKSDSHLSNALWLTLEKYKGNFFNNQ
jgi:hypothetical protein